MKLLALLFLPLAVHAQQVGAFATPLGGIPVYGFTGELAFVVAATDATDEQDTCA